MEEEMRNSPLNPLGNSVERQQICVLSICRTKGVGSVDVIYI